MDHQGSDLRGDLAAVIKRLEALTGEVARIAAAAAPNGGPQPAYEGPDGDDAPLDADARRRALTAWLAGRDLDLLDEDDPPDAGEQALDRLALSIGGAPAAFEPLLKAARTSVARTRPLVLTLPKGHVDNPRVTSFASRLAALGLVEGYRYDKPMRRLSGELLGAARPLLTGGWLERCCADAMRRLSLGGSVHRKVRIAARGGRRQAELDVLWLSPGGDRAVWAECRSARFADRLDRYGTWARALWLAAEQAVVVVPQLDGADAPALSALHGVTLIELDALDDVLRHVLNDELSPRYQRDETDPSASSDPDDAGWEAELGAERLAVLRRSRIRPHAAHRRAVLEVVARVLARAPGQPLVKLRAAVAAEAEVPSSAALEVTLALLHGGALLGDGGPVTSEQDVVRGLSTSDRSGLEELCRRAYRSALRAADPTCDVVALVPPATVVAPPSGGRLGSPPLMRDRTGQP